MDLVTLVRTRLLNVGTLAAIGYTLVMGNNWEPVHASDLNTKPLGSKRHLPTLNPHLIQFIGNVVDLHIQKNNFDCLFRKMNLAPTHTLLLITNLIYRNILYSNLQVIVNIEYSYGGM